MAELATYRYVRLALLALLLMLATSLAAETIRSGWETSVSGYYYTASGPVFVAVLGAVGVCLIALRGFTDAENVCLNLAGISAPMVAFVPTPAAGHHPDVAAIVNNALSFLAVLAIGYVGVLVAMMRRCRASEYSVSVWGLIGLASTAAAWVVGVVWILVDRTSFAAHAHALAAVFTFLPFGGVVVLNTDWGVRVLAQEADASRTRFDAAYWLVAGGMAAVAVVFGLGLGALAHWRYALLGTEIGLLGLFAVFWVLQTIDLADSERDLAAATRPGS